VVLDANLQYMLAYHFFGLLWTIQFITAFGQCVIAGAIATYYWTRGEGNEASPVLNSIYRTARYHTVSRPSPLRPSFSPPLPSSHSLALPSGVVDHHTAFQVLRSRIIEWTGVAEGPLHAGL